jgi:ATP-binding cassette subfamily B protein
MKLIRVYVRVVALLSRERHLVLILVLANLALAGSQFVEPLLFGNVIDTLSTAQRDAVSVAVTALVTLLSVWAGVALFNIVTGTLVTFQADQLAHRHRHYALASYFEHVLTLTVAYHNDVHSGRLIKVMLQGTDAIWGFLSSLFRDTIAAFTLLFVFLPMSLYINWRLSGLLIVLCIIFGVITAYVVRKTNKLQGAVEKHYAALAERVSDAVNNVIMVQSVSRIDAEVYDLRQLTNRVLAIQIPVLSWWALVSVLTRAATTVTVFSVIVVGAILYTQSLISIGTIVTFVAFAMMLIERLQSHVEFVSRLLVAGPRLAQYFDVLDVHPEVRDRPCAVEPKSFLGHVEFDDISFSYDGRRNALSHVSFTAAVGQIVAVVGATGAGKSTALALLYRTFDPQSGAVKIDGIDIRDIKLKSLRRNIGVVFQDPLLFNRSIADNLRIGKTDATEEELRLAAKRAQALDFILALPAGFDSRVGEGGCLLSGGERQRLSIARALLKDPAILILDEPTSAIDTATEGRLLLALREAMIGRTTFVITHRLATVRDADTILVFDSGRIVEVGPFDALLEKGGLFADMVRNNVNGQRLAVAKSDVRNLYADDK